MEYILDTANLQSIKHCNEFYPLSGVTTNPSIIAKENRNFWDIVKDIREIIGPDKLLFAQTVQTKSEKIVEEALLLKKNQEGNFALKFPFLKKD